jgi:hypothetical protein
VESSRRYRVSGTDDLGDVHAFETDDRERAERFGLSWVTTRRTWIC